jgi:hypothetical protein
MLLKTLFKESDHGSYRAEIHRSDNNSFSVDYYSPSGKIKSEPFLNSSVLFVETTAMNWLDGIKVLKG